MTDAREAQINDALKRYTQALEALQPRFEIWREAMMLQAWADVVETLRPALIACVEWWISHKREVLYLRLRRWHFPHLLARFLADRWPWRWLPEL
jgi:hypothetical protein